jgi:hypothetical protein
VTGLAVLPLHLRIAVWPGVGGITAAFLAFSCTDQLIRSGAMKIAVAGLAGRSVTAVRLASGGHDLQGVDLDAVRDDRICARRLLRRWGTPA